MKDWMWKLPSFLVVTTGIVFGTVKFIGVRYDTAPIRLDRHIADEVRWHQQDSLEDIEVGNHAQHIEGALREQDARLKQQERVNNVEQCMENSYSMLAKQMLLATCDSLSIHRTPGDLPPADLEP